MIQNVGSYQRHIVLIKDGELLPIQKGSACLRMGSIAQSLIQRGFRITWLASTWSHQFKQYIDKEGLYAAGTDYNVQLLECGSYSQNISVQRILHHRRFAKKVSRWLNALSQKPDLILSSYPIPSTASAAAVYCQANHTPYILDIRDLWPDVFVDKLSLFGNLIALPIIMAQKRELRKALEVASTVTAVSEEYLAWARQHTSKTQNARNHFVHFPLGAEAMTTQNTELTIKLEEKLAKTKGTVRFSFLGSFGKSYDLRLIIDTAIRLNEEGVDNVHFIIAGDGEQRSEIEMAADRLPNLTYCGWLDATNARALLLASDVGLMPLQSVKGTFPNKPFQYMAAGLPIISSLEGSFAKLVESEAIGYNFKRGDLDQFIHAVKLMLDSQNRSTLTKNVAYIFAQKYEQSVIYNKFADTIEETIGENSILIDAT